MFDVAVIAAATRVSHRPSGRTAPPTLLDLFDSLCRPSTTGRRAATRTWKKKGSAFNSWERGAVKQQGRGRLYCLSVVYGPAFSFNYNTKLNSNRLLEGGAADAYLCLHAHSVVHVRHRHARARPRGDRSQTRGPSWRMDTHVYSVQAFVWLREVVKPKPSDQTGLVDAVQDTPPHSATQTLAEWGPPAWAQGAGCTPHAQTKLATKKTPRSPARTPPLPPRLSISAFLLSGESVYPQSVGIVQLLRKCTKCSLPSLLSSHSVECGINQLH